MWIGTNNGLNIYDGYTFTKLTEAIGASAITGIVNDKKRNLVWVGADNGLYRIDALTFSITKCRINNKPSGVPVASVHVNDKTGDVYAVLKNGQIASLRNKEMAILGKFFEPLVNAFTATCLDDQLLVYTDRPYKFSKKSVSLEPVYDFNVNAAVTGVSQHGDTLMFCASDGSVTMVNAASLTNITPAFMHDIAGSTTSKNCVLKDGILYTAGYDYSFYGYDINKGRADSISARYHEVFEGKQCNYIFVDEQNTVWIGTNKGIIKIDESRQNFEKLLNDLTPRASTRNIIEDEKGDLYVGSYDGLFHFSMQENRWNIYNRNKVWVGIPHTPAALLADKSGRYIYYGFDFDGFYRFDKAAKAFEVGFVKNNARFKYGISALAYDNEGKIWIGSGDGLATYNPQTGYIKQHKGDFFDVGNCNVRTIVRGRGNTLYVGTSNGLFIVNTLSGITAHYTTGTAQALSHNDINCVYEDGRQNIWLGTNGGGITILAANRKGVSYLHRQNGLCNETVYAIVPETESSYWISTFNGLSHLDTKTGVFRAFFEEDGLSTNEFNRGSFMKSKEGYFYFGSINGITRFWPGDINTIGPAFRIFASGLNKWEKSSESMKLSRDMTGNEETIIKSSADLILELYFGSTDYSDPLRNIYLYRIAGLSDKWVSLEDRHILNLSGIPVGEYVVEVRALNPRGTASANILKFNLKVIQPFYKEWWFYFLIMLGIATVIFIVYRIKIQTVKSMHQLRVKIASNLHDEVGSLLTRITMFSDNLRYSRNNEEQRNMKLEKIASLSRNATNSMSDVLWAIDARNDFTGNLLDRMHEHAEEMLLPMQVNIEFNTQDVNHKQYIYSEMRREMYLIFKEAVNNIAKHTNAQNVWVSFRQTDNNFSLVIENDGISPDNKNYNTGQGLENMKLRARRINASIEQLMIGDRFVIRLKK